MQENDFFKKVKKFVFDLFKNKLSSQVVYHNFEHTVSVVKAVREIANGENISEDDLEVLLLAAWFHDTGFIQGYDNHEEKSKTIAHEFLTENNMPKDKIDRILSLIEVTKLPQNPANKFEEIICDADLFHLGEGNFEEKGNLLRAEWENLSGKSLTDIEWLKENFNFLEKHKYFTEYAFNKLNAQKTQNWVKIKEELKRAIEKSDELE